MNILKPRKILADNLINIENLLDEIKETEKLENINLENYKESNIKKNQNHLPRLPHALCNRPFFLILCGFPVLAPS